MCQRLYSFIFIKIFAFLRPLWPPKPRKTFYFITASTALPLAGAVVPCYLDIYIGTCQLYTVYTELPSAKCRLFVKSFFVKKV